MRTTVAIEAPPVVMPEFPPRFFNPGEIELLVHLIAEVSPSVVVEFGCNEGRAAATILANLPSIESYVGLDVLPGYVTIRECQRKEVPSAPGKYAKSDPRFRLMLSRFGSFDMSARVLPKCGAAFIDADHSRRGVLNDYRIAKDIVQPGGIIIFHDDNGLPAVEVTQTLDELAAAGAPILHVADSWLAFERIPAAQ